MRPWYKIGLLMAVIIVLSGIFAAVYLFYLEEPDSSVLKPDYVISAVELQKEFSENENKVSARYTNKIIEVKGKIASLVAEEGRQLTISLRTADDMSAVICTLNSDKIPQNLKEGAEITVRGKCSGYLMDVLLNNCAITGF